MQLHFLLPLVPLALPVPEQKPPSPNVLSYVKVQGRNTRVYLDHVRIIDGTGALRSTT